MLYILYMENKFQKKNVDNKMSISNSTENIITEHEGISRKSHC